MTKEEKLKKLIEAANGLGYEKFFFVAEVDNEYTLHAVQGFSAVTLLGILEVLKSRIIERGEGE